MITPHYEYSIGFRLLRSIDSSGNVHYVGFCYSGRGFGLNNSFTQSVEGMDGKFDAGPIPEGDYKFGKIHDHQKLGPGGINLTPYTSFPLNRGPFTIRMHDDNKRHNFTASEGCLICGAKIRYAIPSSEAKFLEVIP